MSVSCGQNYYFFNEIQIQMALKLLFYWKKSTIMAFIDYYKILGVPRDTPQEKIKEAYKKRVKQFHPD
jgi:preprotein translocase subunit Sec63